MKKILLMLTIILFNTFSSHCRYRDWDRAKGGFYIWGVEENIAATLQ